MLAPVSLKLRFGRTLETLYGGRSHFRRIKHQASHYYNLFRPVALTNIRTPASRLAQGFK
jgi:transposase InsO family protein